MIRLYLILGAIAAILLAYAFTYNAGQRDGRDGLATDLRNQDTETTILKDKDRNEIRDLNDDDLLRDLTGGVPIGP